MLKWGTEKPANWNKWILSFTKNEWITINKQKIKQAKKLVNIPFMISETPPSQRHLLCLKIAWNEYKTFMAHIRLRKRCTYLFYINFMKIEEDKSLLTMI